jgi:cytochrome b561
MQSEVQALGKTTYSRAAILLHWATALCVLIAIPLAIAMNNLPEGPLQDTLFNYHKSFGQLMTYRWFAVGWRWFERFRGYILSRPVVVAMRRKVAELTASARELRETLLRRLRQFAGI